MNIFTFESIEEFAQSTLKGGWSQGPSSWNDYLSFDETRNLATFGREEYADKLSHEITISLETSEKVTLHTPCGGRFNISDVINDTPRPCRKKVKRHSNTAPVKIFVGITTSAHYGKETIEKRGLVILSLLEYLQRERSVDLYLFSELGQSAIKESTSHDGIIHIIHVESRPLSISQVGFALCSPAFSRQLCQGSLRTEVAGFNGGWSSLHNDINKLKETLGCGPLDIFINSIDMSAVKMLKTPEQWLNNQIEALRHQEA